MRRILIAFALLATAGNALAATLTVTRSPTCGCCGAWVERMQAAEFAVVTRIAADVTPTARRLGVPDRLRSCHTAEIGGYAIEGHVPAADIKRMLAEKPRAAGIAVPGMPMGSPGMEHGGHAERYQTVLFDRAGKTRVFASH